MDDTPSLDFDSRQVLDLYLTFIKAYVEAKTKIATSKEELDDLYRKVSGRNGVLRKINKMIFEDGELDVEKLAGLIEDTLEIG